jgi:DNA polymerase IV
VNAIQRKIIHIDMDCFYAAVEERDQPQLRGKPVAVGGFADGRGVLTTANYVARRFGVRSAMPTARALKMCPDLILVPPHFEKYKAESGRIQKIFRQFTSLVEPLSLDEAYLDVSGVEHCDGLATEIAREIRKRIFQETQLTASAGIAPNKFLAKIASDWKKPNGQFTITPDQVDAFVAQLPVEKIPGVGKVTAKKMKDLGLLTCTDLQNKDITWLRAHFGQWGYRLYDLCRGQDERPVSAHRVRKSLSVENTFATDLQTVEECQQALPELLDQLNRRLDRAQVRGRIKGWVVKVKFFDFTQTTLECGGGPELAEVKFKQMLEQAYERGKRPVRLLGLGVRLHHQESVTDGAQLDLFAPQ